MSRGIYQSRKDAHREWPALADFLTAVIHGDDARLVEDDLDVEIADRSLADRQQVVREWWRWNADAGAVRDIRFAVEAFDSGFAFAAADHARSFMNEVYDRLIVSIRREGDKEWKP